MKISLVLSLTLLLSACDFSSEDSQALKNLNFGYESIATCVSESAERYGYESILDVQQLDCSSYDGVIDQGAIDELNIFTNLEVLSLLGGSSPMEFDGKSFPYLTAFNCYDCNVSKVDISQNIALEEFNLQDNEDLVDLDFSNNPNLVELALNKVSIINLTLGKQVNLTDAYIAGNTYYSGDEATLINVDFSGATALESLEMWYVGTSYLDLSQNNNLLYLKVLSQYLENIEINSTKLIDLTIGYSLITSIDTANFPELESAILYDNEISSMNFDYNEKLTLINLKDNPLSPEMIDYLESLTTVERIVY